MSSPSSAAAAGAPAAPELRTGYVAGVMALGVVCGILDVTCLVALGGVFAERMTGNLLLLSMFFGAGTLSSARLVGYLGAIVPFVLGALAAGMATNGRHPAAARLVGFRLEWLFVVAATVLAVVVSLGVPGDETETLFLTDGVLNDQLIPRPMGLVVVALLAFAMGIHNVLMRRHGVPDVATTVLTLTLAGLVSDSRLARGPSTQWQRRLSSIALYMLGAALGAALLRWDVSVPLIAACALFTAVLWPLTRGSRPDAAPPKAEGVDAALPGRTPHAQSPPRPTATGGEPPGGTNG